MDQYPRNRDGHDAAANTPGENSSSVEALRAMLQKQGSPTPTPADDRSDDE